MSKREPEAFRPHWPDGLEARKLYKLKCDDASPDECRELSLVISDDGDVWLGMMQIDDLRTSKPYSNPHPSVRCRTGIGGGKNRRTRQALLWLAKAIQLDNEENGVANDR